MQGIHAATQVEKSGFIAALLRIRTNTPFGGRGLRPETLIQIITDAAPFPPSPRSLQLQRTDHRGQSPARAPVPGPNFNTYKAQTVPAKGSYHESCP